MKSKKLLGILLSVAGVGIIAAVAIIIATSTSSNPDKKEDNAPIHSLSGNEAVSMGLSNMFSNVAGMTNVADSKTETDIQLTINELYGMTDMSGLELLLNIKNDGVNNECSLTASATSGSKELFNGVIFADSTQAIGCIPTLYAGTIVMPYEFLDRLETLIENLESEGSVIDNMNLTPTNSDIFDLNKNDMEGIELPEFDYKAFADGLMSSMEDAIDTTAANMTVENLDLKPLSNGSYYCYKVSLPVEDLANIIKAGIIYSLNNEELQAYVDAIYEATESQMTDDELSEDLIYDYDIDMSTQMSSIAMILDSYWPMIVTELENVLGSNVEFTVYLTDNVDVVGYELSAPNLFTMKTDFSGYSEEGDSTALFSFNCFSGDTTFVDMSLSISTKEFTGAIEKPDTEPVLNLNELTDEQLTALMQTLSLYMGFTGQAEAMPY